MADQFLMLQDQLDQIDVELAKHRGNATPQQVELLRRRREVILRMANERRSLWGE